MTRPVSNCDRTLRQLEVGVDRMEMHEGTERHAVAGNETYHSFKSSYNARPLHQLS